jgi:hypothetical protein
MHARPPVSTWRFGLIHTGYCSFHYSALRYITQSTQHSLTLTCSLARSSPLVSILDFVLPLLYTFDPARTVFRDFFLTLNETDTHRDKERECVCVSECVWLEYIARSLTHLLTHSLTQPRHLALPRKPKDTGTKAQSTLLPKARKPHSFLPDISYSLFSNSKQPTKTREVKAASPT